MYSLQKTARRTGRQRGFTLLELMISIGFMASLAGLISGTSFLAIKTGAETGAIADIAVQTARTTRWLVRDVHRAETTNIVSLAPAVNTASFSWVDGGPVTCTLALDGTTLVRDCGTSQVNIGSYISNLTFERNENLITVGYQIDPPNTRSQSQTVNVNIALGGG